ncbi:HAMP domain-containing histidine kinase [Sedimentibacter hydroxybenzoicus DSM 7310]|uniref:histidine kinase n=2 Tax=Sedimentibacter TaxID=190972 RepID=A0A974GXD6_SEDHY|nr:HAMP domain-containing sensor histidine kinase [Sedimentibacter hydroxybenzoicus]NYB75489.1 HAMP domain-containing histidine kinase [Sedimentibacter hydroxybenzoicus DSM 7310]
MLAYIISSAFSGWISDFVFVFLLIMLILGWDMVLVRMVSSPIREISKAAQRMADLDFSQPCKLNTKDELQTLGDNLNTTATNLQHALAQRKELTDTLSHELKTPLGVIRAYAEGLKDAVPDKQIVYSQVIVEETEKMAGMINALLDLSSLEVGAATMKMEKFDFVELVETVAGREYVDTTSEPFRLSYSLPDESVYVVADQNRLRQVLHNFMGNAKKFVSKNGNIHIEVSILESLMQFSIYNDGPHLTDDVWIKFHRDKSEINRNGSGLGLAISAQILSMHKSEYGIHNKENGAEFYFMLPITE